MSENMTMAELLAAEENHKPKRGEIVKAKVELVRENQVVLAVPGYAGYVARRDYSGFGSSASSGRIHGGVRYRMSRLSVYD